MRFRDTDALSDDEVQHVVLEASVSITMSSDKSNNPYVWLYEYFFPLEERDGKHYFES